MFGGADAVEVIAVFNGSPRKENTAAKDLIKSLATVSLKPYTRTLCVNVHKVRPFMQPVISLP